MLNMQCEDASYTGCPVLSGGTPTHPDVIFQQDTSRSSSCCSSWRLRLALIGASDQGASCARRALVQQGCVPAHQFWRDGRDRLRKAAKNSAHQPRVRRPHIHRLLCSIYGHDHHCFGPDGVGRAFVGPRAHPVNTWWRCDARKCQASFGSAKGARPCRVW